MHITTIYYIEFHRPNAMMPISFEHISTLPDGRQALCSKFNMFEFKIFRIT